jgi:hypothetical protein
MRVQDQLMEAIWEATVAFCTTLDSVGFSTEDIASQMPMAQKKMGDEVVEQCFDRDGRYTPMLSGDAIKIGQDYAEQVAASRAGVE